MNYARSLSQTVCRLMPVLLLLAIAGGCAAPWSSEHPQFGAVVNNCSDGIDKLGTEFIRNGDFSGGLTAWQIIDNTGQHEASGHQILGINRVVIGRDEHCGDIPEFHRQESMGTSGLIAIEQPLDIEKANTSVLKLQTFLRIDDQQLTSDGLLGGETPVFVTIDYQTASGEARSWTHGFLAGNSTVNYPERDQDIVSPYWFRYDRDLFGAVPEAAKVTKITVGGNGQDFHSKIGFISLSGK